MVCAYGTQCKYGHGNLCEKPDGPLCPRADEKDNGKKYDDNKARWDLLPMGLIDEVVDVLTFGAKKYGPDNWRLVENGQGRYYSALMRHVRAFRKGELIDKESGKSHLAHAVCNLLFMFETAEQHTCANCSKAIRGYPEEGDSWWCSIDKQNYDHPHSCKQHCARSKSDKVLVRKGCHNCRHSSASSYATDLLYCVIRHKDNYKDHVCPEYKAYDNED